MSKRTKRKLKNIQMYITKYILNSRYIVRNILAVTVFMTLMATVFGVVTVVSNRPKAQAGAKTAASEEESAVLDAYSFSGIEEASIASLRADFEEGSQATVEANLANMVSGVTDEFADKFVATSDNINVRAEANTDSDIVGKLNNGNVGSIISSDGEWVSITSGSVAGFVKAEFILTGKDASAYAEAYKTVVATVTGDAVCVRDQASTDGKQLTTVYQGTRLTVDETETAGLQGWVSVALEDESKGFISAEFVELSTDYTSATAVSTDADEDDDTEEPEEPEDTPEDTAPSGGGGNEVVPGITARGSIALSAEDVNLMACIVTLESGGEAYEGQLAVANIILNRLQSGKWGSTISDVVYAPNQFTCVNSSRMQSLLANGAQASCIQAVQEAAAGTNNIGSYMSYRALSVATPESYNSYVIIGNHCFFD